MKKSKLSQVVVAAAVVATLGLTAACSGDSGSDGKDSSKDKSSAGQQGGGGGEEKAAPALTEAQLKKALIANGDVEGYKFEESDEGGLGKPEEVAAQCSALGDVITATTKPAPKATAGAGGSDAKMTEMIFVSLQAHEQADAEKVLGDVRTAAENCKGFKDSEGAQVTIKALPEPESGDEAAAFTITSDEEKTTTPVTVVRSGSTLATVFGLRLDGKPSEAPAAVIDAQVKKLEAAAK